MCFILGIGQVGRSIKKKFQKKTQSGEGAPLDHYISVLNNSYLFSYIIRSARRFSEKLVSVEPIDLGFPFPKLMVSI